jgi:DNA-binding transcriptional regulator YiaG
MPSKNKKEMIKHRQHEVVIPTSDGLAVAERIPLKVPMVWDAELGAWLLTAEAEAMVENAKARHMGLMLPHELLALRQRLGLSQQVLGELLQIGAKSWSRWETGRQRPSRSMNLLLRALNTGLLSPRQLLEVCSVRPDWSQHFRQLALAGSQTTEPVSLDVCREIQQSAVSPVEPIKLPA